MIELLLLSVALAVDSMTVSIVNGMKYKDYSYRQMFLASLSFGFFQGFMPFIGYIVFVPLIAYIEKYDHWLILIVLSAIGINMIRESFDDRQIKEKSQNFSYKILLTESIATAIDALSSGIVLMEFPVAPFMSCIIIAVITFIMCMIAHRLGKTIALILKDKAPIVGGIILIMLGVKTVLQHLGII